MADTREAVARIIEPRVWREIDAFRVAEASRRAHEAAGAQPLSKAAQTIVDRRAAYLDRAAAPSLAQADAILALTTNTAEITVLRERVGKLEKALKPLLLVAKSDAGFQGAHPMRDAAIAHAEAALTPSSANSAATAPIGGGQAGWQGIHLRTEQTDSGVGAHVIVSVTLNDGREVDVIRSFTSGDHPDTIICHYVTATGIAHAIAAAPSPTTEAGGSAAGGEG